MKAIGVDWGTTNLRAFYYDADELLSESNLPYGIRHLPKGGFSTALQEAISDFPMDIPLFMYGMVGANTGWREQTYVNCPCNAQSFAQHLSDVSDLVGRPAWMAPGLRSNVDGFVELMRGEEIQVWGTLSLYNDAKYIILPGTHSKLVHTDSGHVTGFQTSMTGELYHVMRHHSILSNQTPQIFNKSYWEKGVWHTIESKRDLLGLLFQTRSLMLSGELPPQHTDAYLSGLIIGCEIRNFPEEGLMYIVGVAELAKKYQEALLLARVDCQIVTITPTIAGHMGLLHLQDKR